MLLTRLPLPPKRAFDLHVLSLPPAFVLSQDQTLKLKRNCLRILDVEPLHIYQMTLLKSFGIFIV